MMTELNDCGCGRSPNGKCIGWHSLSEEDFQKKLKAYKAKQKAKKQQVKKALYTGRTP